MSLQRKYIALKEEENNNLKIYSIMYDDSLSNAKIKEIQEESKTKKSTFMLQIFILKNKFAF